MDTNFTELRSLPGYSYGKTKCSVEVVDFKSNDKVYLLVVKGSDYKNDGEDKHTMNFDLYIVPNI